MQNTNTPLEGVEMPGHVATTSDNTDHVSTGGDKMVHITTCWYCLVGLVSPLFYYTALLFWEGGAEGAVQCGAHYGQDHGGCRHKVGHRRDTTPGFVVAVVGTTTAMSQSVVARN
jgi:hypothetical protein